MPSAGAQPSRRRRAWIVGATGIVGRALAARLAQDGWALALTARSASRLEDAVGQLGVGRDDVHCLSGDITDAQWIADAVRAVGDWAGPDAGLDGLVFTAASPPDRRRGEWATGARGFQEHWQVKCGAPLRIVELTRPLLRARAGSVVLTGGTDREVLPGALVAAMANACVSLAVTYASRDLAGEGVRVNAVSPGAVEMPGARADAAIPFGRRARPEEVAAVMAFLLSRESAYVAGANLVADGGLSVVAR